MPKAHIRNGDLTIRLTKEIRECLDLHDGDELEARVFPGSIVLRTRSAAAREQAWRRIFAITAQVHAVAAEAGKPIEQVEEEIVEAFEKSGSGDIDRTFWEVLAVDHLKLLRNAVEWAANEPRPVTVTGAGTLDVTMWRQKSSLTVHMVNLTNSMMMKGPVREFIPTPPQQVSLRLPRAVKDAVTVPVTIPLTGEVAGSTGHVTPCRESLSHSAKSC